MHAWLDGIVLQPLAASETGAVWLLPCGFREFGRSCRLVSQNLVRATGELLSNLVFEGCRSCGDLVWVCGFNSVFERDAGDDFGEAIKAA